MGADFKPDEHGPACCGRECVFTFVFSGSELYCCGCGNHYGCFEAPETIPRIPEAVKLLEDDTNWFHSVSVDCIPKGARFEKCSICKEKRENHSAHATNAQWQRSKAAYEKLANGREGLDKPSDVAAIEDKSE